jgi:hypothetical protein
MSCKIKCFLQSGLFGLLVLGGSWSFAAACPELVDYTDIDCSFPYFPQGVNATVKHNKNGLIKKFKAKYRESSASSLLFASDDVYEISDTSLKLSVKIKKVWLPIHTREARGKVKIKGRIGELGINKKEVLMKGRLSGGWSDAWSGFIGSVDNPQLISFGLKDLVCNEKIDAYQPCTSNNGGSIRLALNEGVYSYRNVTTTGTAVTSVYTPANMTTAGLAVASVPLPAAAWLFGSGLLGMIGIARRKKAF